MLLAFLLFLALVLVAAALNVISASLGLGLLPEFAGSEWFFTVKNYLADLILWTIAGAIGFAAFRVAADRRRGEPPIRPRPAPARPKRAQSVAVALIAYNEEMAIADVVEDFSAPPGVDTVIVIDNNSRDATAAKAEAAGAMVVREEQQGYGFACIRALREGLKSGADIVVLCEADGTYSAHDLDKLVPFLADADMVIGNRMSAALVHRGSQMDSFFVWGNRLGAKLLQMRFWDWRFLGRLGLTDLGCTFRAIRAESLAEIIDDLSVCSDHFSPHMIMVSLRRGHAVVEVPVTFWPRAGVSKGASGSLRKASSVGLAMFWHILTFPVAAREPAAPTPSLAIKEEVALKR